MHAYLAWKQKIVCGYETSVRLEMQPFVDRSSLSLTWTEWLKTKGFLWVWFVPAPKLAVINSQSLSNDMFGLWWIDDFQVSLLSMDWHINQNPTSTHVSIFLHTLCFLKNVGTLKFLRDKAIRIKWRYNNAGKWKWDFHFNS